MNFEQARFNMVEQQIRPWDVLDIKVLDLLMEVKREEFVADAQKNLAFIDTELPLPNGSRMLQPKVEARLLQDLNVEADDKILEIGTGSGYVTALLATFGQQVYSVEIDPAQKDRAAATLKKAGVQNVTLVEGNGLNGHVAQAPFDAIYVGGSLPVVPESLKAQLAVGGRMVVVVGDLPMMRALRIKHESQGVFSETVLFDVVIDRLSAIDAAEPDRFSF